MTGVLVPILAAVPLCGCVGIVALDRGQCRVERTVERTPEQTVIRSSRVCERDGSARAPSAEAR
jgi:hypothetical protein